MYLTIGLRFGHKMVKIHAETDTVGSLDWKHLFLYLQRKKIFVKKYCFIKSYGAWQSVVKDPSFSLPKALVQSLIRELRSHKLNSTVNK